MEKIIFLSLPIPHFLHTNFDIFLNPLQHRMAQLPLPWHTMVPGAGLCSAALDWEWTSSSVFCEVCINTDNDLHRRLSVIRTITACLPAGTCLLLWPPFPAFPSLSFWETLQHGPIGPPRSLPILPGADRPVQRHLPLPTQSCPSPSQLLSCKPYTPCQITGIMLSFTFFPVYILPLRPHCTSQPHQENKQNPIFSHHLPAMLTHMANSHSKLPGAETLYHYMYGALFSTE